MPEVIIGLLIFCVAYMIGPLIIRYGFGKTYKSSTALGISILSCIITSLLLSVIFSLNLVWGGILPAMIGWYILEDKTAKKEKKNEQSNKNDN